MSSDDFWTKVKRKERLVYPYSPQLPVFPTADDVYKRDLSRLRLSFVSLGNKLLSDQSSTFGSEEKEKITRMLRIHDNMSQIQDLQFFASKWEFASSKTSKLIICRREIEIDSNEELEWKTLAQAVFVRPIGSSKCAVFLVSLDTGSVNVYGVGDCDTVELKQFGAALIDFFAQVLPEKKLTFSYRFQVPSSFEQDTLLMAFIFAVQVHRHCKYLHLDRKAIALFKLKAVRDFHQIHDNWLGHLKLERGYPFTRPSKASDDHGILSDFGWSVVDVLGDGNCGFYALLLGLENNNVTTYNAGHEGDDLLDRWQTKVFELRQNLRSHSIKLLKEIYKKGQEPTWWCWIGPLSASDRKENNDSFYTPKYKAENYFNTDLDQKHHMLAEWGSFVFASLFKMRVVLIMGNKQKDAKGNEEIVWVTKTFASVDNVEPLSIEGIHRLPDDDFRAQPTVEIFYMWGLKCDNHFQFLRRVFCDNITAEVPSASNSDSLLRVLKSSFRDNMPANDSLRAAGHIDKVHRITNPLGNDSLVAATVNETIPIGNVFDAQMIPVDKSQHSNGLGLIDETTTENLARPERTMVEASFPESPEKTRVDRIAETETHLEPLERVNEARIETIDAPLQQEKHGIDSTRSPTPVQEKVQTGKKRSAKVLNTKNNKENEPSKRPRRSREKVVQKHDHAFFDNHYHKKTLKHETAARMKYDPVLDIYWYSNVEGNTFTEAKEVENLEEYDELLVNEARRVPNVWAGCSIGDPIDERVPAHLSTKVKILCEQHNKRFCLTYSMSSALWYCGLEDAAKVLNTQASVLSKLQFNDAINAIIGFMPYIAPEIGRATIYNQRRCRQKKKKTTKKARCITWDTLFAEIVPHPTLVIPVMPNATTSHAFCIVDDLIFDSSFPCALKLTKESIEWIYNDCDVDIYQVFRFNTKCSPKDVKVEATFRRPVELNWDLPSRVYIQRAAHDWHLPHYVIQDHDELRK